VLDSVINAKGLRIQQKRKTSRCRNVVVSDIISVMHNIVSVKVSHTKERLRRDMNA
jgi:hypothetical protein